VEPLSGIDCILHTPMAFEGVIDLSDQVRHGVFAPLRDENFFRKGRIGDYGQIAWSDDLDICSDAAYLEITGKIPGRTKNG